MHLTITQSHCGSGFQEGAWSHFGCGFRQFLLHGELEFSELHHTQGHHQQTSKQYLLASAICSLMVSKSLLVTEFRTPILIGKDPDAGKD